ncbi:MAG: hypothetical protein IJL25_05465 [Clostridia bacterium]|nr:hypothetical protein [Clostridia bacterium]
MRSRFRTVSCIFICLVLLLSCGCAGRTANVSSFTVGNEIRGAVEVDPSLHRTDAERLSEVTSADGLALLYQPDTGAVCVRDTESGRLWSALPLAGNTAASVLNAALVSEKGRCYLNTQDHSVAFGAFDIEKTDNGLRVEYRMSDSRAVLNKDEAALSDGELYLRAAVEYTLADGALDVRIDCSDLFVSEGFVLETLSVLPYFGAISSDVSSRPVDAQEPEDGGNLSEEDGEPDDAVPADSTAYTHDFLLVPDGCGALMYTDSEDASTANLTFRLYSDGKGMNYAPASAGYFGVSSKNAAFVGVIRSGDAAASIRAIRAGSNSDGLSTVYPEYSVTPAKTEAQTYTYAAPYAGMIDISYRFVRDTGGNPVSLAAACRETLIRSGLLSKETRPENSYPMNAAFVVSVAGSGAVTRYAQAEDLAGVLKAKGVTQLNLILEGALSGGLYQAGGYSALRSAGGTKDLSDLCDYAAAQNFDVYAAVNLLAAGSSFGAATDLAGEKQSRFIDNPLSPYISSAGKTRYLASADTVDSNTLRLLNRTKRLGVAGYAVTDAGFGYADIGRGDDASALRQTVNENLKALSSQNRLLLRCAGFGSLSYADVITELSFAPAFPESAAYQAVPFLPAVMHGTLVYSGSAANTNSLYILELLKCVEYGAAPYVRWVFSGQSPLFYELNYSEISEFCAKASEQLGDLSSRRIVGHEKIDEGVFGTTYENGSIVLVNYNNYSANVGNIQVPPYDFLRIN